MENKSIEKRVSNMECVRIIAMSMILIWHFFIHGGGAVSCLSIRYASPIAIIGVDLFLLLSGFFLIRLRWNSLLKLAITVFVFQCITAFLKFIFTGEYISTYDSVMMFIAPLTKSPYYFIGLYVVLMVLSPLFNSTLRSMDLTRLRWLIIVLSVVDFYSCWLLSSKINTNGLFHFIYIYILGYYLSKEPLLAKLTSLKIVLIGISALVANLLLNAFLLQHYKFPDEYFSYDFALLYSLKYVNPLNVLYSCSVVLWFCRHPFSSVTINSIASASLGCYLLQEGFCSKWLYNMQQDLLMHSQLQYLISCVLLFFAFWLCSWIIMLLLSPVIKFITKSVEKKLPEKFLINFK